MRKCKLFIIPLCLMLLLSVVPSLGSTAEEEAPFSYGVLDYGQKEEPRELSYATAEEMLADMTLMASSANLELYLDETNLTIAVKNLTTGHITTSNPHNASSDTMYASTSNKMRSQVTLNYSVLNSENSGALYSATDCVDLGQYIITPLEEGNGVEILYSLGEDVENQIIPDVMTEASYNWLIEQLSPEAKLEEIGAYDIEEVKDFLGGDWGLYTRLAWAELDADGQKYYEDIYPNLEQTVLYIRSESLNPTEESTLKTYLSVAGYTNAMKMEDFAASGQEIEEGEEAVFPNFKFTVRYTIDDTNFYAEVDSQKIEYNEEKFCLENISLLPYFAASSSQKDGYIFLPDGSGTIVSFDDPILQHASIAATLSGDLYGDDTGTTYPRDAVFNMTLHLPVFGIKDGANAVFAIIREGDGMSGLDAILKSVNSSYFSVYPTFTIKNKDRVRMEGKAGHGATSTSYIDQYSPEPYVGNFKVQYNFLTGDDANYVGMAKTYRAYLESTGWTATTEQSIRFQMNTLGSVQYQTKWGFIPYTTTDALTTYQDNQTMIAELKKMGITDIDLQLLGWQSPGLDTEAVNSYSSSSELGGTDELTNLINFCKENKIGFFPQADLAYVANEGSFDGFSVRSDAVRLINNQYGTHATLSPTYGMYMPDAYTLAPTLYDSFLTDFLEDYKDSTGGTSVNLARLGQYLNSDYKSGRVTDRQETLNLVTEMLKNKVETTRFAFNGGNAFVLPYASQMLDVPLTSTGRDGETYDVPFLQMVMMNKVAYAAPAINTTSDRQDYLLRCIESQSSPSFNLLYQNADLLKSTVHTQYYNVDFEINKEDFAEHYEYVKNALEGIAGVEIAEHTRLSTNVVRIRYENDQVMYINFNKHDVTVDGQTIKAQSYYRP